MSKKGLYIKRIRIDALWNGKRGIDWTLRPDVNILSGVNGVGKSTILNRVVRRLAGIDRLEKHTGGVTLTFEPEDADSVDFDVIRSFDRPLVSGDLLGKMSDTQLHSELDLQLYQLQRRYLDYQVNMSNRMVALFTGHVADAQRQAGEIAGEKTHFMDIVDSLFKDTGKTICRDRNEIFFLSMGEVIPSYKLSSGEKQMLIILLTVLVRARKPCVLFMDEPEVSLHVEWQQRLVGLVRDLNPHAQVILTTHSPAVIMDGWADCVTNVEDIAL
ncbi:MAG TPA: ABC transporter ATP-binding protein [Prevotellaceae bacterium]|nr:ABC transporter ATP-binding protein [Prevotellaceae bacterium]HBE55626.1 ABC transporter ATP-binding protein [Prevotellaceae bacterium]